ncbi:MAG: hypothetical protein MO853_12290 [Candidatus Protistobacter heckmanni]|nr:hypothetical protein [Candidatus Protistobacter heckmanni]
MALSAWFEHWSLLAVLMVCAIAARYVLAEVPRNTKAMLTRQRRCFEKRRVVEYTEMEAAYTRLMQTQLSTLNAKR